MLNASEFETVVLQSEKPVVADFYADWCGPCKMLSPILEELSKERAEIADFVKFDIDSDGGELAVGYGIRAVPTVLFFKGGAVADICVGLMPKEELDAKILAL